MPGRCCSSARRLAHRCSSPGRADASGRGSAPVHARVPSCTRSSRRDGQHGTSAPSGVVTPPRSRRPCVRPRTSRHRQTLVDPHRPPAILIHRHRPPAILIHPHRPPAIRVDDEPRRPLLRRPRHPRAGRLEATEDPSSTTSIPFRWATLLTTNRHQTAPDGPDAPTPEQQLVRPPRPRRAAPPARRGPRRPFVTRLALRPQGCPLRCHILWISTSVVHAPPRS